MLKKWINKQTITVFILSIVITSIFPIYAVTQSSINVNYNNIKLSVNDKIIESDVEPFVYQNRTFVPVRFIAEALNMDVKYNEGTDTVEITNKVITNESIQTTNEINSTDINTITKTPDGMTVLNFDNNYYIVAAAITSMQSKIRKETQSLIEYYVELVPMPNSEDYQYAKIYKRTYRYTPKGQLIEDSRNLILDNIPLNSVSGGLHTYIEYNYYINNVMPFLKQ